MTVDIDIIVQNSPENIGRFVSVMRQWGQGYGGGLVYEDFQGAGCVRIEEDFPLDVFTMLDGKPFEYFVHRAVRYSLADGIEVGCLQLQI